MQKEMFNYSKWRSEMDEIELEIVRNFWNPFKLWRIYRAATKGIQKQDKETYGK